MARKARLDSELVRRNLARSRGHAAELIAQRLVRVSGQIATKPATAVDLATAVTIDEAGTVDYVSRGGHKLASALAEFLPKGLVVAGRRCLDAGASTGGFTDVLLRHEAAQVIAVDVGYGQLAWRLQKDGRVQVIDRTNVRTLTPQAIGGKVELTVADLSFISLRTVLDALVACTVPSGDFVLMVKPQFEVGKTQLGSGGVVRDPQLRARAVLEVARYGETLELGVAGIAASSLPGPSGNIEYFLWLKSAAPAVDEVAVQQVVAGAHG